MLKQLQKLDRKLGMTLEQIDRAAQPLNQFTTFEVFRKVDDEQEKAEHLLHLRQDAAGMDYEVQGVVMLPVETSQSKDVCYPQCQLEHSHI